MTAMTEALDDAVLEATRQRDKVRDLIRAIRAHRYAIENPPDGDATNGLNAVMTLDRLTMLAEQVGEELGI